MSPSHPPSPTFRPGATRGRILTSLIRKDLYLQRRILVGSLVAGFVALGIHTMGNEVAFYMSGVMLVTVLIALGAGLAFLIVIEEHQEQTLPFLLSLPVSPQQYALSKILSTLLIFGITWCVLLLSVLLLVLSREDLPNGLVVYTIIILTEISVSTCLILTVAMVTQSLVWTIGTVIVGNLFFNGFVFQVLRTPALVAAAESHRVVWPPEAVWILLAELVSIALLLGFAFIGSTRGKDIL